MAFDVYVGTMTRFYRRDWENAAQRKAREQRFEYRMIYAGGDPEPPPPADEIRSAVAIWRNALNQGLAPHGIGPVEWDEGDEMPYFTDRPAWDGYAALLVWAAHAEHPELPLPAEVPEAWVEDPAYQLSSNREFKSRYRTVLEPELWLPAEFPGVFDGPTLVSEKSCIGSLYKLKEQLDDLLQQTGTKLQALKAAHQPQPAPAAKKGFLGGLFTRKQEESEQARPGLAETAEFGLAIFRDLASKACEHRLPMMLHY